MSRRRDPRVKVRTWDDSRLRLVIVGLVVVKMIGLILIVDVTGTLLQSFDLAKSVFSRTTEAAIAGCVGVALVRFGPKIFPSGRVAAAATAFLAVNLAATALAANRYLALYGEPDRFLGLTFVIDMLVLMVGTAVAFRTARDWAVAGAGLAGATLIAVGYAAVQFTGNDPIHWAADPRLRPFSTFGNPDMFGEFLSVAIGVAIAVTVIGSRPAVRACAVIVLIATSLIAVVTQSRGTAVAVAAALIALVIVMVRVYGGGRATFGRITIVGLVGLGSFAVVIGFTPLGDRVRGSFGGTQLTLDRVLLYDASLHAFFDRPISGWGPDNFGVAYPLYRQVAVVRQLSTSEPSTSAHSWLFQTAVATGALGVLALLGLIALAAQRLWSALRVAPTVSAAMILGSVAYWTHAFFTVGTVSVDWFPWVAFGAAVALAPGASKAPAVRSVPAWAYAAPLVAALLVAWSATSVLAASGAARVAGIALDQDVADIALSEAQAAVLKDDGRAEYWNTLGRAYSALHEWRKSAGAFIEATRRSPHDSTYWINLAKARAQQALAGDASGGGKNAAIAAANSAVALDPSIPEPLVTLCDVSYAMGEYDLSLDAAGALLRMLPASNAYDGYAARAAIVALDPGSAHAKLETFLTTRESALLHLATAQLAVKLNDLPNARMHAKRALELDPTNAGAQRLLATIGQ